MTFKMVTFDLTTELYPKVLGKVLWFNFASPWKIKIGLDLCVFDNYVVMSKKLLWPKMAKNLY